MRVSTLSVIVAGIFILGTQQGLAAGTSQAGQPPAPRVVDLKATDGTLLKATYFAAAKPGPGALSPST